VFVKELERALLSGEIDMAVHSLKDLPATLPEGLVIASTPERADARDALIAKQVDRLEALPEGACVATSSPRRRAQLLAYRPDLRLTDLRGNIDTRLKRLTEADGLDAIILAAAGLDRLGWGDRITERIDCEVCMPAVSQGALAIETRVDDDRTIAAVSRINHVITHQAILGERAFLRGIGGGCHTPVGAWGRIQENTLHLDGILAALDGSWMVRDTVSGAPEEADESGRQLADKILNKAPQAPLFL
jgi:hydroxymethylbilane synthase